MSSNAEAIKSFIVALGFNVDQSGMKKFASSIAIQTEAVRELAAGIKETAIKVVDFTKSIASTLDTLYFMSKRTNSSAANIRALGVAAEEVGSSADSMSGSLENLHKWMREKPGGRSVLESWGVQIKDLNTGKLLQDTQIFINVKKKMDELTAAGQEYRASKLGDMVGMSYKDQLSDTNALVAAQDRELARLKSLGINADQAAEAGKDVTNAWKEFNATLHDAGIAIFSQFNLKKPLDDLNRWFIDHAPDIKKSLKEMADAVKPFGEILLAVGGTTGKVLLQLIQWFDSLSPTSQKVIASLVILAGSIAGVLVGMAAVIPIVASLLTGLKYLQTAFMWFRGLRWIVTAFEAIGAVIGGVSAPVWITVAAVAALVAGIYIFRKEIAHAAVALVHILKPAFEAVADVLQGVFKTAFGNVTDFVMLLGDLIAGRFEKAAEKAKQIGARTMGFFKDVKTQTAEATDQMAEQYGKEKDNWKEWKKQEAADKAASTTTHMSQSSETTGNASDPRGIRNNNPGNINFAGQEGARKEGGTNGRFAVFATAREGLMALARLLRRYASRGIDTVRQIISKWAPAGAENPNQGKYISSVAQSLGVGTDEHINVSDPRVIESLMRSITQFENGKNPYGKELLASVAMQASGIGQPKGDVTIHQKTEINVNGASDARGTAQEVLRSQHAVNSHLVRNMKGKAQ